MAHQLISSAALLLLALPGTLLAQELETRPLSLATIFADQCVLQQGESTVIWGRSEPGELVSVSFGDQEQSAETDEDGYWQVELKGLEANAEGRELRVSDSDEELLSQDVLVGEVWLCSGQSNMEWNFGQPIAAADLAYFEESEPNNQLRIAHVSRARNWPAAEDVSLDGGGWRISDPAQVKDVSVIGWFFTQELQAALDVPVGLICSAWGGTPIEDWLPPLEGQKAPGAPGTLWGGMIEPLAPLNLAGFVWYQGESNIVAQLAVGYQQKQEDLIALWRAQFGNQELPFYICQIAPFNYADLDHRAAAEMWRAQQAAAESLDEVEVIPTQDIGERDNIHPKQKHELGRRLAATAWAGAYGNEMEIEPVGPHLRVAEALPEGEFLLHFDTQGALRLPPGKELDGFEIFTGGIRCWAAAELVDDDKIMVRFPPDLEGAVLNFDLKDWAIRYGWHIDFASFLTDDSGLPMMSFRTDEEPWDNGAAGD